MTKRLLLSLVIVASGFSTGCHFWRRSHKVKESSAIATGTEQDFKQRWIKNRLGELAAQGVTGEAAEAQADREFREKYTYALPKK